MIGRLLVRLIDANAFWARPLGDFNVRVLRAVFARIWPVKDFLNGKWLGHSLHAALTDAAIGAFISVTLLDLLGHAQAADVVLGFALLAMVATAVAGYADYTDTDALARMRATVHNTVMLLALVVYAASLALRLPNPPDRTLPIVLELVGLGLLLLGAFIGGDVVYALGNMISRHAWRADAKGKWQELDVAAIPEAVPTKAKAGSARLLVVRYGQTVYAMDDVCSHAGGPLSEGQLVDGQVECPWHGSRYDVRSGRRTRGPTTFDQPYYEVRQSDAGGYEVRRVTSGV